MQRYLKTRGVQYKFWIDFPDKYVIMKRDVHENERGEICEQTGLGHSRVPAK